MHDVYGTRRYVLLMINESTISQYVCTYTHDLRRFSRSLLRNGPFLVIFVTVRVRVRVLVRVRFKVRFRVQKNSGLGL